MPFGRAQDQVGEAGFRAQALRGKLVEGDAVANVAMRILDAIPVDPGEEPLLAVVAVITQVRHAGEEGEAAPMLLEQLQVAGRLVIQACFFGK